MSFVFCWFGTWSIVSNTQEYCTESYSGAGFVCDLDFSTAQFMSVSWGHCFSGITR